MALVGAGLPDLRKRLLAAKPYADRLFTYRELDGLSHGAAAQALRAPAARLGIDYEDGAVAHILENSAGYPYFIQVYGQEVWDSADGELITLDDAAAASEAFNETLSRSFFAPWFELATDAEQRYLISVATLPNGPYRTSDIAKRYGTVDQRGVSVHRDSLIRKGLIWSAKRGEVDYTVPLFGEYIRQAHPFP